LIDPKTKKGYSLMHFNYLKGGGDYVDQTETNKWENHDKEGYKEVQDTMNALGF
jgi:hypothetical protein